MAFKLPRVFFPLGAGARTTDREPADVGDTVRRSAASRSAEPRSASDPGRKVGSKAGPRAEDPDALTAQPSAMPPLPLIGALPLRRQQAILVPLILTAIALAILLWRLDADRGATAVAQSRLVGEAQLHVQRLAKAASLAVRGTGDGFRQMAESRSRLAEAVTVLQTGGTVREQSVDALGSGLRAPLARLTELWRRTDPSVASLQQLQPTLSAAAQSVRAVLDAQPRLIELGEQIGLMKVAAGAPAVEVAASAQLLSLTYRTARDVIALSGTEPGPVASVAALARDAASGGDLIDALLRGNESRRIAPARDPELRARLGELRSVWSEIERPLGALAADAARVQSARAAEAQIVADSEPLRAALTDLQTRIAQAEAGRMLERGVALLCLLLAALGGFALARARYRDIDRRAAQADAQRAQAERLEREAKRSNDVNQAAILRLMNELQEVADGDLTVQATVTEDITGAIADSVNYTVEELRSLVSRINITAELVAEASGKAQTVSASLQLATEQQSRAIRETGQAVLRMAARIKEVSASASESARVARQSLGAAEKGRRAVQNSIAGMNGIRDQIQQTSKRIKRLGESSQEIGEIVELISDITEQTNVLALNAAIQAASAGEAGRGFTVVAEEVQRLAERSAAATRQISQLIRAIQFDTQDAVAAMERSTAGVVAGTRLSDDAGNALTEIGQVSTALAELIEMISRATSEQASSAGTVAHSIQRILLVSEQTNEGTQHTAGSILQLAELARELKNSVSRFRVA
jgi:twitching motility protein PilJ